MAASLRSVGFDVIEVKDATLKQMREATRRFADKLEVSDVGLVCPTSACVRQIGVLD